MFLLYIDYMPSEFASPYENHNIFKPKIHPEPPLNNKLKLILPLIFQCTKKTELTSFMISRIEFHGLERISLIHHFFSNRRQTPAIRNRNIFSTKVLEVRTHGCVVDIALLPNPKISTFGTPLAFHSAAKENHPVFLARTIIKNKYR